MTASPEFITYMRQLRDYYTTAARDGTHFCNPPRPPSVEVAMDFGAQATSFIGQALDYEKTGVFPDAEPSPESRLVAAEFVNQFFNLDRSWGPWNDDV